MYLILNGLYWELPLTFLQHTSWIASQTYVLQHIYYLLITSYNSSKSRTKFPDSSTMSWNQRSVLLLLISTISNLASVHMFLFIHSKFISYLVGAGNMFLMTKSNVAQFDKFDGQSLVFSNQQHHFCRSIFVSRSVAIIQKHLNISIIQNIIIQKYLNFIRMLWWKKQLPKSPIICSCCILYFYFWQFHLDSRQLKDRFNV